MATNPTEVVSSGRLAAVPTWNVRPRPSPVGRGRTRGVTPISRAAVPTPARRFRGGRHAHANLGPVPALVPVVRPALLHLRPAILALRDRRQSFLHEPVRVPAEADRRVRGRAERPRSGDTIRAWCGHAYAGAAGTAFHPHRDRRNGRGCAAIPAPIGSRPSSLPEGRGGGLGTSCAAFAARTGFAARPRSGKQRSRTPSTGRER